MLPVMTPSVTFCHASRLGIEEVGRCHDPTIEAKESKERRTSRLVKFLVSIVGVMMRVLSNYGSGPGGDQYCTVAPTQHQEAPARDRHGENVAQHQFVQLGFEFCFGSIVNRRVEIYTWICVTPMVDKKLEIGALCLSACQNY